MSVGTGPHYDAIVIGAGVAGFSAAVSLRQQGKKVAVLRQGAGASSISSGAWSFGAFANERYFDAVEPSLKALEQNLPHAFRRKLPFLLASASGAIRSVYIAQAPQAAGDLSARALRRVAVVGSKQWRYRGDLLARQWNESAKHLGLDTEFRSVDLPTISDSLDVPLSRVATELRTDEAVDAFAVGLSRLAEGVDLILIPSLFPSFGAFERAQTQVSIPIAETLCSTEPNAGHRLYRAIEASLRLHEIDCLDLQQLRIQPMGGILSEISILPAMGVGWVTLKADHFVIASGRFLGGGLGSRLQRVEETLLDLPLYFPQGTARISDRGTMIENAQEWSALGIRVDAQYRPLAEDGKPAFANLVACGSIIGKTEPGAAPSGLGVFAAMGRHCVASIV